MIKKILLALSALTMSIVIGLAVVLAEPVDRTFRLNWTMPTMRTDGTPLTAGEIDHTQCSMRVAGSTDWVPMQQTVDGTDTNMDIVGQWEPGDYELACRVQDTDGEYSEYTNFVTATVEPDPLWPPGAPSGLSVEVLGNP